jgi:NADH:ubiquinone oxidoreductase subunit F (NADH-binding)
MENNNHIKFEDVVNADPTLRFFLREAPMDFDLLEHQAQIMGAALMIVINKWLDLNYK